MVGASVVLPWNFHDAKLFDVTESYYSREQTKRNWIGVSFGRCVGSLKISAHDKKEKVKMSISSEHCFVHFNWHEIEQMQLASSLQPTRFQFRNEKSNEVVSHNWVPLFLSLHPPHIVNEKITKILWLRVSQMNKKVEIHIFNSGWRECCRFRYVSTTK